MSAESHLTEKELIIAAVDTADLETGTRDHLSGCTLCRRRLADLTGRLAGLSRLAEEMVPASRTRFHLPEREGLLSGWFHRPLTLAAGAAATAALALAVWFVLPMKTYHPASPALLKGADLAAIEDTAPLIARAGYDPRATLSDFHQFVTGELPDLEDDADDGGFLDNLAPAVESI